MHQLRSDIGDDRVHYRSEICEHSWLADNGKDLQSDVMPLLAMLNPHTYLATDNIETMPDMMAAVHSVAGRSQTVFCTV